MAILTNFRLGHFLCRKLLVMAIHLPPFGTKKNWQSRRDVDDLELSFKFIPLACFAGANVLLTTLFLRENMAWGMDL